MGAPHPPAGRTGFSVLMSLQRRGERNPQSELKGGGQHQYQSRASRQFKYHILHGSAPCNVFA